MSTRILQLDDYRKKRRLSWRKRYKSHLCQFFQMFIEKNLTVDLIWATQNYQSHCYLNHEYAWDYRDFRDLLREAIDAALGDFLYIELKKQWWFDERWLTKEEALDHCLSAYVLGDLGAASSSPI